MGSGLAASEDEPAEPPSDAGEGAHRGTHGQGDESQVSVGHRGEHVDSVAKKYKKLKPPEGLGVSVRIRTCGVPAPLRCQGLCSLGRYQRARASSVLVTHKPLGQLTTENGEWTDCKARVSGCEVPVSCSAGLRAIPAELEASRRPHQDV